MSTLSAGKVAMQFEKDESERGKCNFVGCGIDVDGAKAIAALLPASKMTEVWARRSIVVRALSDCCVEGCMVE